MQIGGAVQGVNTIPRRRRLNALLAIAAVVLIAVLMVTMLVWNVSPAPDGVGAEDAVSGAGAGSAIIHDDAGNVRPVAGTGSAIVHDDAGNVNR